MGSVVLQVIFTQHNNGPLILNKEKQAETK